MKPNSQCGRLPLIIAVAGLMLALLIPLDAVGQQPAPAVDLHGDRLPAGAVARLGTTRYRLSMEAYSVAYSPDGRYVAVGGTSTPDNQLVIFEAATGKALHRLPGHAHVVRTVAFSPDSKLLASGGGDARLVVWDVAGGKQLWKAENCASDTAVFLGDGKQVAAGAGKEIRLFDAATGQAGMTLLGHGDAVYKLAASSDGKLLASTSFDRTVRVWDALTGKESKQFPIAEGHGMNPSFSRGGDLLTSGTSTGAVYLWDLTAGKEHWRTSAGNEAAGSVAFSPDSSEVLCIRYDFRVLEAATGKERRRFELPAMKHHLAPAPDGKTVAAIGRDAELVLIDVLKGQFLGRLDGHAQRVRSLAWFGDGRSVVTASGEKVFRLWDAGTGRLRKTFEGQASSVAVAPGGKTLATTAAWDSVSLWDVDGGQRIRKFDVGDVPPSDGAIAFTANDPVLVVCDVNGTLKLWNAATGKRYAHSLTLPVDLLSSSTTQVLNFAVAADGKTVAASTRGNSPIRLWDLRTGKDLLRTEVKGTPLAFAPNGRLLAARSAQGIVLVDTRTGEVARTLPESTAAGCAAFSPDGYTLATAGDSGAITLWEVATLKQRRTFAGHEAAVRSLAFSPDGGRLASGSDDMTVLIWDVYSKPRE
jgi:WD40 repeat protein